MSVIFYWSYIAFLPAFIAAFVVFGWVLRSKE
jgi:hypothetical protein